MKISEVGDEHGATKTQRCKLDSQLGPTFSSQTDLFSFSLVCLSEREREAVARPLGRRSLRHAVLPHVLRVAVGDDGAQLVDVLPQPTHLQQLGPQPVLHLRLLALVGRAAHGWNGGKRGFMETRVTILREILSRTWSRC